MTETSQPASAPPRRSGPRPAPGAVLGPEPPEVGVARETRDASTLWALAGHHDPRVRAAVGRNPEAPDTALDLLTRDQEPDVLEAVASNPALSDERFADLFENTPTPAGTKVIPALFNNGPRGAYAQRNATVARGLLYFFAAPFAVGHLVLFSFGGKVNSRHVPAGHPVALQTFVAAAAAFALARALYPMGKLTAAKLRATSAWPAVAKWVARAALVALLAAQVRACVVL